MAKILFISETYTVHDRRFLEKLSRTPHTVWFLPCSLRASSAPPLPWVDGVQVLPPLVERARPWRWIDWVRAERKVRTHIRLIQPDLVHAGPIPSGTLLAALSGAHPLLAMSWGSDVLAESMRSGWRGWLSRWALRRSDMGVADCLVVRDRMMQMSRLREDDFAVFPWGIDLKRFYPGTDTAGLRNRFQIQDQPVILHTRGFEPIHDPLVFLAAMERVVRERPDARAWMLGEGSLRKDIERFIQSHGLEKSVRLTGTVPNDALPDYYRAADLYVSTTRSDGTSISLLEAMACGLSVIVVDAYGNKEWVRPGENGWRFTPGDPEALSRNILKALEGPALRRRMGETNIALSRQRADWDANFQILLTAYDRLLGQQTGTHSQRRTAHA